jgi:hypothetical protein
VIIRPPQFWDGDRGCYIVLASDYEALERELAEVTEEYAEYRKCNVAELDLDKAERDALKARVELAERVADLFDARTPAEQGSPVTYFTDRALNKALTEYRAARSSRETTGEPNGST